METITAYEEVLRERRIARIKTSGKLLLKMLDMEGGVIWNIKSADEFGDIEMLIEHPDLPLVKVADPMPEMQIMYQIHYGENGSLLSVERIDPPKKKQDDEQVSVK